MTQFNTAYTRLLNALDEHGIDTDNLKKDFAFYNANPFNPVDITDPDFEEKTRELQARMNATHAYRIANQVDSPTFEMVESIMNQKKENYWLIATRNNDLYRDRDWPAYAKSLEMGLAGVKDILITNRKMLDDVLVSEGRISFFAKGEEIIRMQPMPFEPVDESGRSQAESCFKNLQQSQLDVAVKRLQKLPGMEKLPSIKTSDRSYSSFQGNALLPSIKTTVKIIKDSLEQEGIDVSLSVAQEITARFLSGHAWQVLIAMSKKAESQRKCVLPPVVLSEGPYGEETRIRYYRTYADCVWSFAKQVQEQGLFPELDEGFLGDYKYLMKASAQKKPVRQEPKSQEEALRMLDEDEAWNYAVEMRELRELDVFEDSDEFLGVLGQDHELAARHLKELFYTDLSIDEKIKAFNRNEGADDFLRLKNWLFSIQERHQQPMLRIEKVGDDGLPVGRAQYIYIYKGEIEKTASGNYELRADYGRDLIMNLDEFSEEELQSLKDFSGLSSYSLN